MDFTLGSKKRGRGEDEDAAIRTDGTHMDKVHSLHSGLHG
jgi:hypothetical protein